MEDENDNFTLSSDINGPLLAAVISIEMIGGLIANSFVLILTTCHIKTWKQPSTIFLTNMLISNLLMVLFVMPFSIVTCSSGQWLLGDTVSQKEASCKANAYINMSICIIVTLSLVLLSFDRYFFIVKSFAYEQHMTPNKAVIIIIVSWILGLGLSSPPLYGLGMTEFSDSYGICIPAFENEPGLAIYFLVMTFTFISSIVITSTWTFCYARDYLKKRNTRRNRRDSVYLTQRRKLIGLFGALIIVHIICYFLFLAIALIAPFLPLPQQTYAATCVLIFLSTILTPLVQVYFRCEVRDTISSWCVRIGLLKRNVERDQEL
ncbi:PREDICTED: G-protein coupled receptor 161-like [Amphimedon queenslandica]|uniref:G-protein coupled receptors family 1 profile domain-containing protein n=1 Tax=Amphimedon queenslandica TaxID=400682 RepID=A0A1X7UT59_AMPQE|nr:PREDICTED: G-protein coupled receptor 161-like [Amphimedon queenslandica]|eukprot:XP_019852371.1 PREDICTED: G-protein coupled receptor 161-like [Amphimedon queenslandica]